MQDRLARSRGWRLTLVGLVCASSLLFAFRQEVRSGFNRVLGDSLDGFIQISIAQHWDNVVHGVERWNQTSYFFPWPDTLGYNDGYLLHGLAYALARPFGADPFLAFALACMALRAIGFIGFYLLAADAIGLGLGLSLLGAALFTISSNTFLHGFHAQLLTVGLAPLFCWLLWRAAKSLLAPAASRSRRRADLFACLWGCAAAILFGVWLLTGFYTIWFTTVLLALTLAALVAIQRLQVHRPLRLRLRWPSLAVPFGFALAATPFILVYLPKAAETGMHRFSEVLPYTPSLLDLVHLGQDNLLFGPIDAWVTRTWRPGFPDLGEHTVGFGPVLLLAAAYGVVLVGCERRRSPVRRAIAVATVAAVVLAVHVGQFTLWYWVHRYVPAAGAVRVITRFALVLTLPVILLALFALEHLARSRVRWVLAPLLLLLLAEEYTGARTTVLDRPAELEFRASIPAPPAGCRAFFTEQPAPAHLTGPDALDSRYPLNTDAMMISELIRLPTINGISTFNPPDWELIWASVAGYRKRVRLYLNRHDLEDGICSLDLAERTWREVRPTDLAWPVLAVDVTHAIGPAAMDPFVDLGWDGAGPTGRWTIGASATLSFALPPPDGPARPIALDIEGAPFEGPGAAPSPITLEVNGHKLETWHPAPGSQHLRAVVPSEETRRGVLQIRLEVAQPRSPRELGMSADERPLGLFVRSLRLESLGERPR
jgi:hypothetical protein